MRNADVIQLITQAIKAQKPVTVKYISKAGTTDEIRFGYPHALYKQIINGQDQGFSLKLDLYQIRGDSLSGFTEGWKCLDIEGISDIEIHSEEPCFRILSSFNPSSSKYKNTISIVTI